MTTIDIIFQGIKPVKVKDMTWKYTLVKRFSVSDGCCYDHAKSRVAREIANLCYETEVMEWENFYETLEDNNYTEHSEFDWRKKGGDFIFIIKNDDKKIIAIDDGQTRFNDYVNSFLRAYHRLPDADYYV